MILHKNYLFLFMEQQQLFTAPSVFNFANYPLKNKHYSGSYNCDLKRPNHISFTPKICSPCVSKGFEPVQKVFMDKSLPSATCFIRNATIKSKDFVLQPLILSKLTNPSLKYLNSTLLPMTLQTQSVFIDTMQRMEEIQLLHNSTDAKITVGGMGKGVLMLNPKTKKNQVKLTAIGKKSSKHKHRCPILPSFIFIIYKSENFTECYKIPNSKDCQNDYKNYTLSLSQLVSDLKGGGYDK